MAANTSKIIQPATLKKKAAKASKNLQKVTARIPVPLKNRLDAYSDKTGVKLQRIVQEALERFLPK